LLNIAGGMDLTLFEAQDAADIVSAASTSDVNIIFGTTINENLGDEVVVTVIATGIKDKDLQASRQQNLRGGGGQIGQRKRPKPTQQAPEKPEEQQTDASEHESQETNDPFGDWDIRKEPNLRDRHNRDLDADETEENNQRNDIFNRNNEDEVAKEDDELDTPPFFRRRRRNE